VKGQRGKVVRTLATTHLLDRIATSFGCLVVETPVGFKYLAQAMLEGGVLLAGEESGGLSVSGHIPEKDGILANLMLAQMRLDWGKPFGQVLAEVYQLFGQPFSRRLDLHLHTGDRERIEARLSAGAPHSFGGLTVESIDCRDGYKFQLADGAWLLLRFSGTEPLVRIYGEADSAERLEAILADALEEVERV
jgi:phosphomannomutase